ncbi:Protein of unknown function [Cotesia congregata]|uniref:Uncharacterized protein n=1 Tax=Cotesia congregata TaxID=51543 RepID=A0A8J2EK35_COTCN|nr:Protein of unknown function [Cotesia congregata]
MNSEITKAIVFTDDLIVYTNRKSPENIKELLQNYFAKLPQIENEIIKELNRVNENEMEIRNNNSSCLPPQAFIHFDSKGLIQSPNNIPVLYYTRRHQAIRKINGNQATVYNTTISNRDFLDFHILNKKYLWLTDESLHRKAIAKRREAYNSVNKAPKKKVTNKGLNKLYLTI